MTPIEYIDFMAHHARLKAAAGPEPDSHPHLLFIAESMEKSAAWFREQDPALPTANHYPNPESYYPR